MKRAEKAERIRKILDRLYPLPPIPLRHRDPFTLLIAVLLSAQCTDERVNRVTPALFAEARTASAMAKLPVARIRQLIRSCGLAPSKARNISALSKILVAEHGGSRPRILPGPGGAPRRRPQVGQRGDVPGLRASRLSRRYPHPPPGRALGSLERRERGAHGTGSEADLSRGGVEQAPPADHLLRPRALSGPRSRPGELPDLLLGRHQEAHRPGEQRAQRSARTLR